AGNRKMESERSGLDDSAQGPGDWMMLRSKLGSLWFGLRRRPHVESSMTAEVSFHIEARAEDLVRNGLSREEALRQARLEFGSLEKYKEEIRGARGLCLVDELRADLRYGLRSLRRSPAFTMTAVISLALGIGGNTLIFTLIDSTFLQPLSYRDPGQLAVIWSAPVKNLEQIGTSSVSTYF